MDKHRPNSVATGGLSSAAVKKRIEAGKVNRFTQETSRSIWSIFRANTFTLFNGIIAGCLLIMLALGRFGDAFFVASAFANALIGTVQEFRTKRTLDKLALVHALTARVRRDGREQEIPVYDIVVDDLLVLRPGDQVPVDGHVLHDHMLQVDESILTGESDPIYKSVDDEVLSSSIVVGGWGYIKADKVGADSYANRFAGEAKRFSLVNSELRGSIDRVLKIISWVIGPAIILSFSAQIVVLGGWEHINLNWQGAMVATVASIVAMIPTGLVLMTSISFALAAVRLARSNVLVQELAAVESLARVDMICLDKTGTITEGEIVYNNSYILSEDIEQAKWESVLAWYGSQPDANATARSLSAHFSNIPSIHHVADISFSSKRKWSAVQFDDAPLKGSWYFGAPEMLFNRLPLDEAVTSRIKRLSRAGDRILIIAHSSQPLDIKHETAPDDLQPLALVTLKEKIRSDAKQTLRYFAEQGVAVKIISGDNPSTVAAIARRVGLKDVDDGFDARFLPEDPEELRKILQEQVVFGRVAPEQKKLLVTTLKSMGHTVAMTGDGINDTLAIKEADMGIAMNSGSAATKAVARLILLDGKFSHLPKVVAEGRQVIANMERLSMLFFTKTTYAVGLAFFFGVLLMRFPFIPRQLSIVDSLTIGFPAFFLALLPNQQRYQPGFLRRSLSFAIPTGLSITIALVIYSVFSHHLGVSPSAMRTGATLLLTLTGIWTLTVLSRPINFIKLAIIAVMMLLLFAVFAVPFVRIFFQLVDIPLGLSLLILSIVVPLMIIIGIIRSIHRRKFDLPEKHHRVPAGLRSAVVLTYIVAYLTVVLGILLMLARYLPQIELLDESPFELTIYGALVIVSGFLVVGLAAGIRNGDQPSRMVYSVLIGVVVAATIASLWRTRFAWTGIPITIVYAGLLMLLWTGRARAFFNAHRS